MNTREEALLRESLDQFNTARAWISDLGAIFKAIERETPQYSHTATLARLGNYLCESEANGFDCIHEDLRDKAGFEKEDKQ